MKKLFLSTLLFAACVGAFAQELDPKALKAAKKELQANIKTAKSEATRAEKPDFTAARAAIKTGLASPLAQKNAELFYTAGLVEFNCFNAERNKPQTGGKSNDDVMYSSSEAAYNYYVQAYEYDQMPNEKGKVAPKFTPNIVADMTNIMGSGVFSNAAIHCINDTKDYAAAVKYFNLFLDIMNLKMFENDVQAQAIIAQLSSAETINQIGFYRAYSAFQIPDYKASVEYLNFMKGRDYEANNVYQLLSSAYLHMGDTVQFENALIEGAQALPTESYYPQTLINLYLQRNEYAKAIDYLDKALALDPSNAQFYDLKGRLVEVQGDENAAMDCYKKAIELDGSNASAYGNIGRILFNRAVAKEDDLYSKKKFDEADKVCEPLYMEALPYMEKSFSLEVDNQTGVGLRQIYYKLIQKPSTPNKAELKAKYNDVSAKIGMEGIK